MKFSFILAIILLSSTSHAYQEGTFACSVDAFTTSKVVVTSLILPLGVRMPYVQLEYRDRGVMHELAGLATVGKKIGIKRDKTTGVETPEVEESLYLAGYSGTVLEFGPNGEVSTACEKK